MTAPSPGAPCSGCAGPRPLARKDRLCQACRRVYTQQRRAQKSEMLGAQRRARYQARKEQAAKEARAKERRLESAQERRLYGAPSPQEVARRRRETVQRYRADPATRSAYNAYARAWRQKNAHRGPASADDEARTSSPSSTAVRIVHFAGSLTLPERHFVVGTGQRSAGPLYATTAGLEDALRWAQEQGYQILQEEGA